MSGVKDFTGSTSFLAADFFSVGKSVGKSESSYSELLKLSEL